MSRKKRIVVAMSGGVDSSVAAAMLVREGHEVVGITMRLADSPPEAVPGRCCAPADIDDARQVARTLGIPFYVMDLRREFEDKVIKPFAQDYAAGRTPNPCILCNEYLKFQTMLRRAKELDADALATGHHARIVEREGHRMLAIAADKWKDQSYFLFMLDHQRLAELRFPVGEITKQNARKIAAELNLKTADKPESQEICFVQEGRYDAVVERYADKIPKPGDIVSAKGKVMGKHQGIHHYTIGQRKGLGVAAGRPLYVMELVPGARRVVVGFKEECSVSGMELDGIVWNDIEPPSAGMGSKVKIRYKSKSIDSRIFPKRGGGMKVIFEKPQPAVTPGQAAVFYRDDVVQGGGWIKKKLV